MTRFSNSPFPAFKNSFTTISSTMSMIIVQIKVGTAAGAYHYSASTISRTIYFKAFLTSGACHFSPLPPPLLNQKKIPAGPQVVAVVARVELTSPSAVYFS